MAGERTTLSQPPLSLALGLLPPLGYCHLHCPPPQGAPHTCATGPAGISFTTPPSWILVTVCQFSSQISVHLHSAPMLIISFLFIAHCYPAYGSSQLSASALLLIAIQLMAFLISVHLHSKHLLAVHQEQLLFSSTSRSLLSDAYIDILHNSHWLMFHPRAVTPLGSSPSPRTRVAASVNYACSHSLVYMCSR